MRERSDSIPYTKLSQKNEPRPDIYRAMILQRKKEKHLTREDMAEKMGINPCKYDRLMKQHTSTWTVDQLTKCLRAVGVRMTINTNYVDAEQ